MIGRLLFFVLILLPGAVVAKTPAQPLKVSVYLTGLTPTELHDQILSSLSIKAAENEEKLTPERIELLTDLGEEEITYGLEALGYYRSQVNYQPLHFSNRKVIVQYNIKQGPPTYINSVNVHLIGEGAQHPFLCDILNYPSLIKGVQLKHQAYEEYKEELLGKALQLGYLDATFTLSEIRINAERSKADIVLTLDTGQRYAFGDISFIDKRYPSCYLERYIPFKKGEPYTTEQISNLYKRLWSSDLFTHVRIYPETTEIKDLVVPMTVRLKDKAANTYTAGVGYGDETRFRGNLGWTHRLTRFPGHQINANIHASQKRNRASLLYAIPGLDPNTEQLLLETSATQEHYQNKYSRRFENSITQMTKFGNWEQVLGLRYLQEKFRECKGDPTRHSQFLFPTVGYIWKNLEQTTPFPHGFKIQMSSKAALQGILSTTNLAQIEIEPKWIILTGDCSRLIIRGDFGATYAGNPAELPLSLRFFAGGEGSIRGYKYDSLGPKDQNACRKKRDVVGARYLMVGSIEMERVLWGDLSGALFVDGGNAINRFRDPLAVGAGFGVRWATPLGPFRLDVGNPIKKQTKFQPRIHLSFGIDL